MKFNKAAFPEISKKDFEDNIQPLIENIIDNIEINDNYFKFNEKCIFNSEYEKFPYYNVCMSISLHIWDKAWKIKGNFFVDFDSFKKTICDQISQIVFFNLIRCFSEQIKQIKFSDDNINIHYYEYCKKIFDSKFEFFYDNYPIAWNRIINIVENKLNSLQKTILLTEKHRKELNEQFNIPINLKIKEIITGGDTHNNGSSVSIINFEMNKKVIFKPRSLSGEIAYRKFISSWNEYTNDVMYAIKALDYKSYGFAEYLSHNDSVKNMKEVGQLAFIMYLLNASDMHFSNVRWTSKGLVPIDLETLFQPNRFRKGLIQSNNSAYSEMENSVYGTGIIPISIGIKGKDGSVDVGFAGIRDKNSKSPFKLFSITNGFTSDIRVVWENDLKDKFDNNLIADEESENTILKNCEDLISGFYDSSEKFFKHKDEIISSVLNCFQNIKIRYIHNMTFRYEQLLRTLTDSYPSKDRNIMNLILARVGILGMTSSQKISLCECKHLVNGDIPYFTVGFNDRLIKDINGNVETLLRSPREEFLNKAYSINKFKIDEQIRIIRIAFMAKLSDPHLEKNKNFNEYKLLQSSKKGDINNIKCIEFLKNSLMKEILDDRYDHLPKTWIGPVAKDGGKGWSPGVLGYDLYSGRIGPALALYVAGKVTKDEKAIEISLDIFEKSSNFLNSKSYDIRNLLASGIGAYSGITGLFWALAALSKISGNDYWMDTAKSSLRLIDIKINKNDKHFFDMISGKSGMLGMRYKIDPNFKLSDDDINNLINLVNLYVKNNKIINFGLAHGLSQIVWILSIILQRQSDSKIENKLKEIDNILINGKTILKNSVSTSWCNGSSGILIAYLEAYKFNKKYKSRVLKCIENIELKKDEIGFLPILCHGNLGVYDSVEYAEHFFKKESDKINKQLIYFNCAPNEIFNYFKNGKGRYPLSPGLMAGKSGALLHLCKRVDNDINISPLTMEF
ncbi:type 2 lanthipeptide synthetase LanM [Fructilactobacillus sanfranciscensis]|uniref:type 2 lanthipeptide synthetase LanM n=1 Tax=Fructilactobacillus sanfranciscensis TaxID=1625 RepID=UPI00111ABB1F|nr:type 2 lanthipeptide synthetase LanM [Fructilactobacillus sanfranciscensis]MVF15998.1 type 2 lantipeptide synthetase LanM [Fructilactobacillus sanfranciscensis]TNK95152.1 hypothetical protein DKP74_06200 [Fructilactobacillus sanfranciscensis]TNK97080.1 hypothetical protein DKP75_05605 [Fructilactobacillus sanfranciscensis]